MLLIERNITVAISTNWKCSENFANKSRLSFILEDDSKELIYPGSIIYIPQKTNFENSLQTASIWAPIISSIALSLTSLSVLNNSN